MGPLVGIVLSLLTANPEELQVGPPPGVVSLSPRADSGVRLVENEFNAPTAPSTAMLASLSMFCGGIAFETIFAIVLSQQIAIPQAASITAMTLGGLMLNFGPNFGDLLNEGGGRFAARGLLRMLLLGGTWLFAIVLSIIQGYGDGTLSTITAVIGSGAWLAWSLYDVIDSSNAPKRWAERRNEGPVVKVAVAF
jgi:hypothetical protein